MREAPVTEVLQDQAQLLHELRTHQIELELQNEELLRTQEELLRSRDRFADLYDSAPVGYATISQKGMILEANLTLVDLLGTDRLDLIGRPFSQFVIEEDADVYYLHRREALEAEGRVRSELRMRSGAEAELWVSLDTILVAPRRRSDLGGAGGTAKEVPLEPTFRVVVGDITERIAVDAAQRVLERQLQRAQKLESLGVLVGGISHDFNNILMAILGNVELALDEIDSGLPTYGYVEEIRRASERAVDLTGQMLAYSGKTRVAVEPIDASDVVADIAALLRVAIPKKILLEQNFESGTPKFDGDLPQLRQVVLNLITNAAEAIGDSRGVIKLSTGEVFMTSAELDSVNEALFPAQGPMKEGPYVYLEVADDGCGMDAATLDQIFDPFFTTKFTGRGLGLSAILGIVRGHRGTAQIESTLGKGTVFRVFFPASLSSDPLVSAAEAEGLDASSAGGWIGWGTVLIVDDEPSVGMVGCRMLERLGFDVLTATDGRETVELCRERRDEIRCVLLDFSMPEMDGAEAFRALLAVGFDAPVILCSGHLEAQATRGLSSHPPAGFLEKPFGLESLRDTLRTVLGDAVAPPALSKPSS